MSRKTTVKAPPAPLKARAEALLRGGQVLEAVNMARELSQRSPTEENVEFRKHILTEAASTVLDNNRSVDPILEEADTVTPADPTWIRVRAGWLARSGRLDVALRRVAELNDPKDATRLLHMAVDQAIHRKSDEDLPPEHQAGFAAIMAAIAHYEAGEDERVRETLQAIGLQSPFLDWKVFLRGLMAFASNDPTRAIENWERLDRSRLAHRLVVPLRFTIDPAYRESLPAIEHESVRRRSEMLTDGELLAGLRQVRQSIGRDKHLATALREAAPVVAKLRTLDQDLLKRFARCLYNSMLMHGHPDDLARYRKLFGSVPDDPNFDKLEALIMEQCERFEQSHRRWLSHANWLAAHPQGWPSDVADRACAIVWFRMATNANLSSQVDEEPVLLGRMKRPQRAKKSPLTPDLETCLRNAMGLAPEWREPPLRLVQSLLDMQKPVEAEAAARAQLARDPGDLDMLREFGTYLMEASRYTEAQPIWLQALALQPLDSDLRVNAAFVVLSAIRHQLATVEPATLQSALGEQRTLLEAILPMDLATLESTLANKAGATEEAARHAETALAMPNERIAVAYRLAIEGTLANLKPKIKTQNTQRLKAALESDPLPLEVAHTLKTLSRFEIGGLKYRGSTTHLKQALELVTRCVAVNASKLDFVTLAINLEQLEQWKTLQIFAEKCAARFPAEATFPFYEAVALFQKQGADSKLRSRLRVAKKLLTPEQTVLRGKIEELEKAVDPPFDFDSFFRYFDV